MPAVSKAINNNSFTIHILISNPQNKIKISKQKCKYTVAFEYTEFIYNM